MYEVSIQMFFQKEVKFLWAHHAFKFIAPECEKSSSRPPTATAPSPSAPDFPAPRPLLVTSCCIAHR